MGDWKETLNLPRTAFPMRARLPQREPGFLERWRELDPYAHWQDPARSESFVLHDGPPYANGEIHIGHALNKILKDFVVKRAALTGRRTPFIPGWDCHGLPIETQVTKELGASARELDDAAFRQACRAYAERFVEVQRASFQRLGVFADWDRPYLTMDFAYEAETLRRLADLVERGYVYRMHKPVHWCPSCLTALAEAEVEYRDHTSPSILVRFPFLPEEAAARNLPEGTALLIWTTTPWTLPANQAVALDAHTEYVAVRTWDHGVLVVAAPRLDALAETLGVTAQVATLPGEALIGAQVRRPYHDTPGVVLAADFVELETGTGLVHIAPGHGQEDYLLGRAHDLSVESPVDAEGRLHAGPAPGLVVWEANDRILANLEARGLLVAADRIDHSYPHCWRCKGPILFRATDQWFVAMDDEHRLRERALAASGTVRWRPEWGEIRIRSMLEHRPDWCISRQRRWGVPIAIPFCATCGAALPDAEVMRRVADRFEAEGADAWFREPIERFLPQDYRCPHCGGERFRKETDILDVWFDSGISWAAAARTHPELARPVLDMYLEGSDQHRGWFQSSLLLSVALRDRAPFREVLTHGFVVDGKGRKMSKTEGNVVSPHEVIERHGAEILRWWVASEQTEEDVRISPAILEQVIEAYRRVRNTFRFLLGNLFDFDPARDALPPTELEAYDRYVLARFARLETELARAYEDYAFHRIYHQVVNFATNDLSATYLDISKDRLYVEAAGSRRRRSAQTVLHTIAERLALALAPILSFTAEEVWQHLPGERPESIFLATVPEPLQLELTTEEEADWAFLERLRQQVLKELEALRAAKEIGHALEARVRLVPSDTETAARLERWRNFLPEWFIVSAVELAPPDGVEGLRIEVHRAPGAKCGRCWHYAPEVGSLPDQPELCARCHAIVTGAGA